MNNSESSAAIPASFTPGGLWPCTAGNHINAGGGGFYYENGTYYWVGEKRTGWASLGINLYSSTDLYNWTHEGVILTLIEEEGHPLEPGCIMERPKLLFNRKLNDLSTHK